MSEACREPLGPMRLGSVCETCGHPAPAHNDAGEPCVMCWIEERVAYIKQWTQAQRIPDADLNGVYPAALPGDDQ